MRLLVTIVLVGLLGMVGCEEGPAPGAARSEPYWSTRAYEKTISRTGGATYALDLPKGMHLQDRGSQGMRHTLPGIAITLSVGGIEQTLADFKQTHDGATFHRQDTLPDGFSVTLQSPTYTDARYITVHQYRTFGLVTKKGYEGMTCHIELSPVPDGPSTKAVVPAAEAICTSLQMLTAN